MCSRRAAASYLGRIYDLGASLSLDRTAEGELRVGLHDEPANLTADAAQLLTFDKRAFTRHGAAWWGLFCALVARSQTMYRRGDRDGARQLLAAYQQRYGHSHILTDVDLAQCRLDEQGRAATVPVRNTAARGVEYLEYFNGRHCRVPSDGFGIRSDGEAFTCCPSYLVYPIGNVFTMHSIDELKSSEWLAKIKESVLNHKYGSAANSIRTSAQRPS